MSETSRVVVERTRRRDADELLALNRANTAYHAPWVTTWTDRDAFEAWFAKMVVGPNVSLLARERATNDVVGVFNLSEIVLGVFRSCFVGYWGYAHTGARGLVTEALREVARFGFDEIGLHRIEANIQPGNVRSIALAQRAGFTREGVSARYLYLSGAWRDHEHWVLLSD